jgi:restriction system protein
MARPRKTSSELSLLLAPTALLILGGVLLSNLHISQAIDPFVILFLGAVGALLLGLGLIFGIYRYEKRRLRAITIANVDKMTGVEFEQYIGKLLDSQGYSVNFTPGSGDWGIDIVAKRKDKLYGVQIKRSNNPVTLEAVQEVVGGLKTYYCTDSMVVTNSRFTRAAEKLADVHGTQLVDRNKLIDWILVFQKKQKLEEH